MGRLSCICRPKSTSAVDGSLFSIDLRQRRALFGSELNLWDFLNTFLTILTWLSMNPLLFGQLGELVTCLNPYSVKNRR